MEEETDSLTFLNLVVQKITLSNIKDFMRAWLSQECKDFKIVFIQREDAVDEQKQAAKYALNFAILLGYSDLVVIVDSEDKIPKAKQTKILKDTSILPIDKMEVMHLRSKHDQMKSSLAEDQNSNLKDEDKICQIKAKEVAEKQENQKKLAQSKSVQKVIAEDRKKSKQQPDKAKESTKAEKMDANGTSSTKQLKTREQLPRKAFFRIIVPNYNNMAYVKKSIDSILEQTFKDFFIIIVDDVSTDGSDKVCKIYAKRNPDKIVFLKMEKKGYAGGARNKALDYPLDSSYTMFLDSDDWMYDRNVLKKIHIAITKKKVAPKIVRCPLFHFLGVGAKGNRVDRLPLGKMNILLSGCGPSRNCIKSELVKKFVENRSKSNDVVWFLRTIDKVKDSEISEVKFPCEVYNRISTTSCQNNVDVMISKRCIQDQKLLAEDLKKETFTSKECIKFQQDEIWKREHLYKPTIQLDDLLANSYVISIDQPKHLLFQKIFKVAKLQPTPILSIGSTIDGLTGPQNCTRSHVQVVKTAQLKDLPYVCVFEDDAFPCINCAEKFSRYLDCIPYNADFVLLGWSNYNHRKRQRFIAPFNKIEQPDISGSHAYILFKSGYSKYLKFFEDHPAGRADNNIFANVGNSYILNYPLFIQYSRSKSMNNHVGYILYGDHMTPPIGFPTIDKYLEKDKKR